MTGTLDTDSSSSADSHAMEATGNGFLPDLPLLPPSDEWSLEPVRPHEPDSRHTAFVVPGDSDLSQDSSSEPPREQNSPGLTSVEKAVEQFQLANAQLFQEEQQQPPQPTEAPPPQSVAEPTAAAPPPPPPLPEETTLQSEAMPVALDAMVEQDGFQGNVFVHRFALLVSFLRCVFVFLPSLITPPRTCFAPRWC